MILIPERRAKPVSKIKTIVLSCTLVAVLGGPLFGQQKKTTNLYVGPNGSDKNPGTLSAPFKTIEAARDHVRALKKSHRLPAGGLNVIIKSGDYIMPTGLKFDKQDSGTPSSPVSYIAEKGAKVNLIAGKVLNSALLKPLSTTAARRVYPGVDRTNLVEIDLRGLNLVNASRFAPANCFSDSWHIIDFFANDKRQPLSQWPNPQENIRNNNDPGWVTCNGSQGNKTFYYGPGGKPEDGEYVNELDLDGSGRSARWASAIGDGYEIWLKGFWRVPWEPFTIKVGNISTKENTITLADEPDGGMGSKYSPVANKEPLWRTGLGKEKWRAINLLEEIDYPGEWALDVKDQKIYFYAPSDPRALRLMIADSDEPVIQLTEASNIRFIGLNISGTRANGVEFINSSQNIIAACTISNVGSDGIVLKGGKNNLVQSNDIFETGGAGLVVANSGDRKSLEPSGVVLTNNHIYQIAKLAFKEAIQLANSVAIKVSHNLMHDMPKSAVRTDMVNNCLFEYNEVHNIAMGESDNGAFYNYGGWSTYGNVYRYNFVHHINRSNGFYCDDGDSGDRFYNNIVYDAIDAIKFGGGHHNIAENNLFIRCKDQGVDDRGISRNYRLGTHYEARLLEMKPFEEPWKSYGKKLKAEYGLKANLWSDILRAAWHPEYPNGCALVDNVSVQCGPYLKPKHGEVTISGNLELPSVKDAAFYNLSMLDLRTDNPEVIKKIPKLNSILPATGLRKDSYRTTVPSKSETGGLENRGKAGNAWDEDQLVK
ncbi:right-handed parallel beta-helix repeat-containing protein [Desertivirga xinjiangensis]|uniref:right-handed parallel beta-helix repeat-containing protein n=1 Tax=Desertivirga xinjiangensis TaxID=539206 RepID=UPI00210E03D5|nr:right-handed parallel beta-helix repeat-containing protein [Pedobacter xinjiangensis]